MGPVRTHGCMYTRWHKELLCSEGAAGFEPTTRESKSLVLPITPKSHRWVGYTAYLGSRKEEKKVTGGGRHGIRTHTVWCLRPLSLPLEYSPKKFFSFVLLYKYYNAISTKNQILVWAEFTFYSAHETSSTNSPLSQIRLVEYPCF